MKKTLNGSEYAKAMLGHFDGLTLEQRKAKKHEIICEVYDLICELQSKCNELDWVPRKWITWSTSEKADSAVDFKIYMVDDALTIFMENVLINPESVSTLFESAVDYSIRRFFEVYATHQSKYDRMLHLNQFIFEVELEDD